VANKKVLHKTKNINDFALPRSAKPCHLWYALLCGAVVQEIFLPLARRLLAQKLAE
jgi:hypothetical protein